MIFMKDFIYIFNFLLYELTLLEKTNQDQFYEIIKEFIFDIFDGAYNKGKNYILEGKIELFDFCDKISNKIDEYSDNKFKEFYDSKSMIALKNFLNLSLKGKNDSLLKSIENLEKNVKQFEKQYNIEFVKYKIDLEYLKMLNLCQKYNNLIDGILLRKNSNNDEDIKYLLDLKENDIQKYIDEKDACFSGESYPILENISLKKVNCSKRINIRKNILKVIQATNSFILIMSVLKK